MRRPKKKSLTTRGRKFVLAVVVHTPIVKLTVLLIMLWLLFAAGLYWGEQGALATPLEHGPRLVASDVRPVAFIIHRSSFKTPPSNMKIVKPSRRKHSYVQHFSASPGDVFPLLCPVMEVEWVPGWMPGAVITDSGLVEQDCIFVTASKPQDSIWVVTGYDPDACHLQMYKVSPEHTVTRIDIALSAGSDGGTSATVTYEVTSIGKAGERFVEEFTEQWYEDFMVSWEKAMNHYLKTGRRIA